MWSICRIAFFFTTPNSTSMPSAEYRFSVLPVAQSESSANGTRQRQREQDRERVDQALELRRQDHVHEDDRQQERPEELVEGALQLAAAAGDRDGVRRRQVHLARPGAQRLEAVGQGVARRDVAARRR